MPQPKAIKSLALKISGTGNTSVWVETRNLTTNEYQKKQPNSSGNVEFNLAELSSDGTVNGTKTGITTGNLIEYKVLGNGYGGGTYTVSESSGGKTETITLTAYSTSNSVGVSI